MVRVYYVNYIDPKTGFLKREESTSHRDIDERIRQLKAAGVTQIVEGSFETS